MMYAITLTTALSSSSRMNVQRSAQLSQQAVNLYHNASRIFARARNWYSNNPPEAGFTCLLACHFLRFSTPRLTLFIKTLTILSLLLINAVAHLEPLSARSNAYYHLWPFIADLTIMLTRVASSAKKKKMCPIEGRVCKRK